MFVSICCHHQVTERQTWRSERRVSSLFSGYSSLLTLCVRHHQTFLRLYMFNQSKAAASDLSSAFRLRKQWDWEEPGGESARTTGNIQGNPPGLIWPRGALLTRCESSDLCESSAGASHRDRRVSRTWS